eukprot:scaffold1919_cov69-Cylindrotheca_fusiformis.AAC.2
MAQLSSLMDHENPLAATTAKVDVFGMTPLHLLFAIVTDSQSGYHAADSGNSRRNSPPTFFRPLFPTT